MSGPGPRTIDLFCGAGGSSYGARNAGCQIVAGFDRWEPAIRTFSVNFPEAKAFHSDIRELLLEEVRRETGDIDLILASPECTSHSKAKGAAERSEESRQSAFEVVRFARVFLPVWIVIENVIEMQLWDEYDNLLRQLKELGYYVRDDVRLNAKDFGVPQSRERLFILCSRLGEPEKPKTGKIAARNASTIIQKNTYSFSPLRKEGRAKATIARAENAIRNLGQETPFLVVYCSAPELAGQIEGLE